jgi:hypothetical protein
MKTLNEVPKLNSWPFILGDIVLLGTAALIAHQAGAPLTGISLIVVVVLVALGAALACVPFLLNYTRRQDLALAERQNEIAALARTTAESAEQIGVAAAGLHTIAETTAKALKHLDQLPLKLQEKINEFKTQLNEVNVTENEALAQEIATLRSSEIERLETTFASVRKTADQLAALETTTRQHLVGLSQALAQFLSASESHTAKTVATFAAQRAEAEQAIAASAGAAIANFERASAQVLASLEARLKLSPENFSANAALIAHAAALNLARVPLAGEPTTSVQPLAQGSRPPWSAPEPPPLSERPPEISVVGSDFAPAQAPVSNKKTPDPSPDDAAPTAEPARKRPSRRVNARAEQPSLSLELADGDNEYSQLSPDDALPPPAVSADGLTRLLVTAYIGIGNKLFVRGEGPGLSWEKGAPLQFVSIGKWRWETADAVEPLALKLYKNDEQECATLGTFALAPGHQQEVRASF